MDIKTIFLTSKGLQNINGINSDDDFTFIYGEKSFNMKINFAEFISPRISRLRSINPTINSISFNFPFTELQDIFTEDTISILTRLSKGFPIDINQSQSFKLQLISVLLSNEEIFNTIDESFQNSIDESNLYLYINHLKLINHFSDQSLFYSYSNIIEYLSSNFYSINKETLLALPKQILYLIISNNKLKIESEDQLYDFIHKIFNQDSDSSTNENERFDNIDIVSFYEQIIFIALSYDRIAKLLDSITSDQITTEIFQKMKEIILRSSNLSTDKYSNRYHYKYKTFEPNDLNGIIRYLTKQCGGNVYDKGIVGIDSSPEWNESYLRKNVVDLDSLNFFGTRNSNENAFISFDFKERKIHPTHYTIRARSDGDADYHHPKKWVIEGSNDKNNWKIISGEENVEFFLTRNTIHTFKIKEKLEFDEKFKFLRMRQTGPNVTGDYHLCLSALEFFGYLYEN